MEKKPRIIIGIDPGTLTGIAVWDADKQSLLLVESMPIHKALDKVLGIDTSFKDQVLVRWEDARLRRWFGRNSNHKQQGAGSIKRDCRIWEAFFEDYGIKNEPLAPKNIATKIKSDAFKKITKWTKQTSEHGRDAAMMVFKYK